MSEILSNNVQELEKVVEIGKYLDELQINIDYEPVSETTDILLFYALRILQVYAYFDNILEDTTVDIMTNERIKNICTRYWEERKDKI